MIATQQTFCLRAMHDAQNAARIERRRARSSLCPKGCKKLARIFLKDARNERLFIRRMWPRRLP